MGKRISMATRAELVGALGDRYRASSRTEKSRILDEFVAVSGYHRKHAIRLLRERPARPLRRFARLAGVSTEPRSALR
jgi:hypothetical protein